MTKQEEYQLTFRKVKIDTGYNIFMCTHTSNISIYIHMGILLNMLDNIYTQHIIENLDLGINGLPFDDFPEPFDPSQFEYATPNVLIAQQWTIPMQDFRQLLQEWLDFMNQNS